MVIKDFSPYSIVKEALIDLKQNEREVVAGRFGVDTSRKTLSAIGKTLKLSRERIRQIEKEGLKKIANKILEQHKENINKIVEVFEKSGGVTVTHKVAEKFLDEAHRGDPNQFNSLNLIFFVMPQLRKIKKTRELEDGWMLAKISKDEAVKIIGDWSLHLKKASEPQTIEVLVNAHPAHNKYELTFLSELPSISKRIIMTETGSIGLASWAEINPRNIRDKIYYILKKDKKPMHFNDIAEKIQSQGFDQKKVVRATVHNELIADKRFVLVGRGIYALKEWGYVEGTVAEIIGGLLSKNKEPMTVDEITKGVLKQRLVKKNTVLINLKTKAQFKAAGANKYSLR